MEKEMKELNQEELEEVNGGETVVDGQHYFEIKYTDPHSSDTYRIYEWNHYSIQTLELAQQEASKTYNYLKNPPRDCRILVCRVR